MACVTHAALGGSRAGYVSRGRAPQSRSRVVSVRARAVEEPKSAKRPYRGALFPGVELPEAGEDAWRGVSSVFPWGNGAPVTEKVLGDLLKEEVRAAPLFVPLYDRAFGTSDDARTAADFAAAKRRWYADVRAVFLAHPPDMMGYLHWSCFDDGALAKSEHRGARCASV